MGSNPVSIDATGFLLFNLVGIDFNAFGLTYKTMAEQYLAPNDPIVEAFTALPIDGVTELPIRTLTPSTIDDGTRSYTPGPIEAYALRVLPGTPSQRVGQVVIWIADGNHRYFEHVREGRETIATKKVVPDREHDIRFMFDAADKWEEV